ncbi:hypothetical protein HF086_013528 [Spodoptera exigua]|uniref:Tubulin--tyrosine ligase-like protein 5 n=1 Tax=Spodoptera exigua TaxID=7107 RepID=A0A922MV32_SPOEX|nr:hypothetical protein HF086_013528 [Spodoptera exigua]
MTDKPNEDRMRKCDDEASTKENEGSVSDWISGGPLGSKGAVLVFRSCVLASRTPSVESETKTVGNNTGTTILLNKAKNMARRLVAEPHTFSMRSKNIMHDVMETFGSSNNKYNGNAYVVRHVSDSNLAETVCVDEQGHEERDPSAHKRDIEDVLHDLSKITLKKHLNIENTTANIKPPEEPPPHGASKDGKDDKKGKKNKGKHKRKTPVSQRATSPNLDSDDSERLLVKEVESVKVLESSHMPARLLKITYKLVNTETKLLHRLLQAHGLQEAVSDTKDFNLLWSGLHPKPDVLRSLSPYQRVNHFPSSSLKAAAGQSSVERAWPVRGGPGLPHVEPHVVRPNDPLRCPPIHAGLPESQSFSKPEQIPKGENVVVAKYIDKPLLIGGHKCDLRLYVCVTSIDPLLIYLYEEGLVRFATVKYDKTNKNLWNPCMHLCNYSINKYHTDYIKCDDPNAGNIGHKWTLSALLRHLRKQGRNTTALMAAIEDLVVKSILSSAQTITAAARVFVPNFFNCFELFGYDILIDDMLKPWLLEINLSPSLACESPLDARVKSALLADTLTLVGLPAVPMTKADISTQSNSLKMRIGACRRVHSAENVFVRGKRTSSDAHGSGGSGGTTTTGTTTSGSGSAASGLASLTGEELRLVRAVRAQYARRGGFVRIFPSQNSWQKYSQLKRYEAVSITCQAPAVWLGETTPQHHDTRRAKELVKRQLMDGMKLTMGEARRAFGLFLTHVLKRVSSPSNELGVAHASLVLRFLRKASASLRMPYNVKSGSSGMDVSIHCSEGPPAKMCDKDRCAVIAKQLNDFLYMYYRETDLYTDSEDKEGCVSNIHFAQFLYSASEADLEDVLLLQLKMENYQTTFLGDARNMFCVDLPPAKLCVEPPARHTLLKHLACLSPNNTRKYRPTDSQSRSETDTESEQTQPRFASSDLVLKESLKEEKPLNQALKYARS